MSVDLATCTTAEAVAITEGQGLFCPYCGSRAQSLDGSGRATPAQLLRSCWVGDRDTRVNCGMEYQLRAGLLSHLKPDPDDDLPSADLLPPALHTRHLALSFLRAARRHPMVSADAVLLLLDRLHEVEIRTAKPRYVTPAHRICTLTLGLSGLGSARTLLERHKAELQALLADLFVDGKVWPRAWCDRDRVWYLENHHQLGTVVLTGPQAFVLSWSTWPELTLRAGGQNHGA
jgi:hypothetical protein